MIDNRKAAVTLLACAIGILAIGATTQIDWQTQIKNRPSILSDSNVKYATFGAACVDATSNQSTLSIGKSWPSVLNLVCSAPLEFNGGIIQPGNGQTVVFTVQSAPLAPICDISAGGICIIFSVTGNTPPEWWGALRNGVTNDRAAIQDAITSGIATGMTVQMQPGTYLSDTMGLNFMSAAVCNAQSGTAVCGTRIIGAGHAQTFLKTTTAAIDLLCAPAASGAGYPVYDIEGLTLIGPDSASPGTSGNGLCVLSTAINAPYAIIKDVYARGFFGSGKAGIWLDSIQTGWLLEGDRVDLSDYGFRFSDTGGFAGVSIGVASDLNTSLIQTRGFSCEECVSNTFNQITAQGTHGTGIWLDHSEGNVFNGVYLENNNTGGSGYGMDLETGTRGNSFLGVHASTSADKIFLNGTSGGANPVKGNTFSSGIALDGNQAAVIINNVYSIGQTWLDWSAASGGASGTSFSGAGNIGGEQGTFLGCLVTILPSLTTAITGQNAPCNLYQTNNAGGTVVATLPAGLPDGTTLKIEVLDVNTSFGTSGNIYTPDFISPWLAEYGVMYTFTAWGSSHWSMSGNYRGVTSSTCTHFTRGICDTP